MVKNILLVYLDNMKLYLNFILKDVFKTGIKFQLGKYYFKALFSLNRSGFYFEVIHLLLLKKLLNKGK
jgi:hypothetical protein